MDAAKRPRDSVWSVLQRKKARAYGFIHTPIIKVEYGIIRDTKRRCLEGKNEGHNFDIEESGMYYVFIRNWSGERTEGGSLVVQ